MGKVKVSIYNISATISTLQKETEALVRFSTINLLTINLSNDELFNIITEGSSWG